MSFKFQLPPITAESGIDKLRSYLMQMTDQLEYALNNIETSNFTLETQNQIVTKPEQYTEQSVDEAVAVLKDMIIKNAEVIESHMDEISQELHGEYTALSSDFGEYISAISSARHGSRIRATPHVSFRSFRKSIPMR